MPVEADKDKKANYSLVKSEVLPALRARLEEGEGNTGFKEAEGVFSKRAEKDSFKRQGWAQAEEYTGENDMWKRKLRSEKMSYAASGAGVMMGKPKAKGGKPKLSPHLLSLSTGPSRGAHRGVPFAPPPPFPDPKHSAVARPFLAPGSALTSGGKSEQGAADRPGTFFDLWSTAAGKKEDEKEKSAAKGEHTLSRGQTFAPSVPFPISSSPSPPTGRPKSEGLPMHPLSTLPLSVLRDAMKESRTTGMGVETAFKSRAAVLAASTPAASHFPPAGTERSVSEASDTSSVSEKSKSVKSPQRAPRALVSLMESDEEPKEGLGKVILEARLKAKAKATGADFRILRALKQSQEDEKTLEEAKKFAEAIKAGKWLSKDPALAAKLKKSGQQSRALLGKSVRMIDPKDADEGSPKASRRQQTDKDEKGKENTAGDASPGRSPRSVKSDRMDSVVSSRNVSRAASQKSSASGLRFSQKKKKKKEGDSSRAPSRVSSSRPATGRSVDGLSLPGAPPSSSSSSSHGSLIEDMGLVYKDQAPPVKQVLRTSLPAHIRIDNRLYREAVGRFDPDHDQNVWRSHDAVRMLFARWDKLMEQGVEEQKPEAAVEMVERLEILVATATELDKWMILKEGVANFLNNAQLKKDGQLGVDLLQDEKETLLGSSSRNLKGLSGMYKKTMSGLRQGLQASGQTRQNDKDTLKELKYARSKLETSIRLALKRAQFERSLVSDDLEDFDEEGEGDEKEDGKSAQGGTLSGSLAALIEVIYSCRPSSSVQGSLSRVHIEQLPAFYKTEDSVNTLKLLLHGVSRLRQAIPVALNLKVLLSVMDRAESERGAKALNTLMVTSLVESAESIRTRVNEALSVASLSNHLKAAMKDASKIPFLDPEKKEVLDRLQAAGLSDKLDKVPAQVLFKELQNIKALRQMEGQKVDEGKDGSSAAAVNEEKAKEDQMKKERKGTSHLQLPAGVLGPQGEDVTGNQKGPSSKQTKAAKAKASPKRQGTSFAKSLQPKKRGLPPASERRPSKDLQPFEREAPSSPTQTLQAKRSEDSEATSLNKSFKEGKGWGSAKNALKKMATTTLLKSTISEAPGIASPKVSPKRKQTVGSMSPEKEKKGSKAKKKSSVSPPKKTKGSIPADVGNPFDQESVSTDTLPLLDRSLGGGFSSTTVGKKINTAALENGAKRARLGKLEAEARTLWEEDQAFLEKRLRHMEEEIEKLSQLSVAASGAGGEEKQGEERRSSGGVGEMDKDDKDEWHLPKTSPEELEREKARLLERSKTILRLRSRGGGWAVPTITFGGGDDDPVDFEKTKKDMEELEARLKALQNDPSAGGSGEVVGFQTKRIGALSDFALATLLSYMEGKSEEEKNEVLKKAIAKREARIGALLAKGVIQTAEEYEEGSDDSLISSSFDSSSYSSSVSSSSSLSRSDRDKKGGRQKDKLTLASPPKHRRRSYIPSEDSPFLIENSAVFRPDEHKREASFLSPLFDRRPSTGRPRSASTLRLSINSAAGSLAGPLPPSLPQDQEVIDDLKRAATDSKKAPHSLQRRVSFLGDTLHSDIHGDPKGKSRSRNESTKHIGGKPAKEDHRLPVSAMLRSIQPQWLRRQTRAGSAWSSSSASSDLSFSSAFLSSDEEDNETGRLSSSSPHRGRRRNSQSARARRKREKHDRLRRTRSVISVPPFTPYDGASSAMKVLAGWTFDTIKEPMDLQVDRERVRKRADLLASLIGRSNLLRSEALTRSIDDLLPPAQLKCVNLKERKLELPEELPVLQRLHRDVLKALRVAMEREGDGVLSEEQKSKHEGGQKSIEGGSREIEALAKRIKVKAKKMAKLLKKDEKLEGRETPVDRPSTWSLWSGVKEIREQERAKIEKSIEASPTSWLHSRDHNGASPSSFNLDMRSPTSDSKTPKTTTSQMQHHTRPRFSLSRASSPTRRPSVGLRTLSRSSSPGRRTSNRSRPPSPSARQRGSVSVRSRPASPNQRRASGAASPERRRKSQCETNEPFRPQSENSQAADAKKAPAKPPAPIDSLIAITGEGRGGGVFDNEASRVRMKFLKSSGKVNRVAPPLRAILPPVALQAEDQKGKGRAKAKAAAAADPDGDQAHVTELQLQAAGLFAPAAVHNLIQAATRSTTASRVAAALRAAAVGKHSRGLGRGRRSGFRPGSLWDSGVKGLRGWRVSKERGEPRRGGGRHGGVSIPSSRMSSPISKNRGQRKRRPYRGVRVGIRPPGVTPKCVKGHQCEPPSFVKRTRSERWLIRRKVLSQKVFGTFAPPSRPETPSEISNDGEGDDRHALREARDSEFLQTRLRPVTRTMPVPASARQRGKESTRKQERGGGTPERLCAAVAAVTVGMPGPEGKASQTEFPLEDDDEWGEGSASSISASETSETPENLKRDQNGEEGGEQENEDEMEAGSLTSENGEEGETGGQNSRKSIVEKRQKLIEKLLGRAFDVRGQERMRDYLERHSRWREVPLSAPAGALLSSPDGGPSRWDAAERVAAENLMAVLSMEMRQEGEKASGGEKEKDNLTLNFRVKSALRRFRDATREADVKRKSQALPQQSDESTASAPHKGPSRKEKEKESTGGGKKEKERSAGTKEGEDVDKSVASDTSRRSRAAKERTLEDVLKEEAFDLRALRIALGAPALLSRLAALLASFAVAESEKPVPPPPPPSQQQQEHVHQRDEGTQTFLEEPELAEDPLMLGGREIDKREWRHTGTATSVVPPPSPVQDEKEKETETNEKEEESQRPPILQEISEGPKRTDTEQKREEAKPPAATVRFAEQPAEEETQSRGDLTVSAGSGERAGATAALPWLLQNIERMKHNLGDLREINNDESTQRRSFLRQPSRVLATQGLHRRSSFDPAALALNDKSQEDERQLFISRGFHFLTHAHWATDWVARQKLVREFLSGPGTARGIGESGGGAIRVSGFISSSGHSRLSGHANFQKALRSKRFKKNTKRKPSQEHTHEKRPGSKEIVQKASPLCHPARTGTATNAETPSHSPKESYTPVSAPPPTAPPRFSHTRPSTSAFRAARLSCLRPATGAVLGVTMSFCREPDEMRDRTATPSHSEEESDREEPRSLSSAASTTPEIEDKMGSQCQQNDPSFSTLLDPPNKKSPPSYSHPEPPSPRRNTPGVLQRNVISPSTSPRVSMLGLDRSQSPISSFEPPLPPSSESPPFSPPAQDPNLAELKQNAYRAAAAASAAFTKSNNLPAAVTYKKAPCTAPPRHVQDRCRQPVSATRHVGLSFSLTAEEDENCESHPDTPSSQLERSSTGSASGSSHTEGNPDDSPTSQWDEGTPLAGQKRRKKKRTKRTDTRINGGAALGGLPISGPGAKYKYQQAVSDSPLCTASAPLPKRDHWKRPFLCALSPTQNGGVSPAAFQASSRPGTGPSALRHPVFGSIPSPLSDLKALPPVPPCGRRVHTAAGAAEGGRGRHPACTHAPRPWHYADSIETSRLDGGGRKGLFVTGSLAHTRRVVLQEDLRGLWRGLEGVAEPDGLLGRFVVRQVDKYLKKEPPMSHKVKMLDRITLVEDSFL
uniref:Uncharacterized protein n=1 Tax=Chromera velia CCMP2878 TaxID=1169474 RepID=A0A0G4ICQ7_9ALVE|eukprot:Cvel_13179.t1-p1 / transcript=Cvel_13179.t1 / gene=Cvel_13179 / organism=Chromera_velia_CCMP2878 / gene_product=hypothetical protein / transcript_product=hypothetical protein / location=Cvel_scaffold890:30707-53390(+) / protein_length=3524 / sequence_SO=supercontig / SO=protein_coding / is_pseudo=false